MKIFGSMLHASFCLFLVSLTELCSLILVSFERSLHPAQVFHGQSCPCPFKLMTSQTVQKGPGSERAVTSSSGANRVEWDQEWTTVMGNFTRGVLLRILALVGVCRPVVQILTLFQTKTCNFPHPFSDQTSKILIPVFIPGLQAKLCYYYLDYRAQQLKFFKRISNSQLGPSERGPGNEADSFGIETINIHLFQLRLLLRRMMHDPCFIARGALLQQVQ